METGNNLLSASRRDSRLPLRNEAAHPYEQGGFARLESVDHAPDYTRILECFFPAVQELFWHNRGMTKALSHPTAVLLAIFVTFLWSSSWILIKIGLRSDLPPITFAGLRYSLAFMCLAPFVLLNAPGRREMRRLNKGDWTKLALLGILTFTITQSAQYAALSYLPAAMTSLILNLTSLLVAISGVYFLREIPSPLQWAGIGLTLLGVGLYFLPVAFFPGQWIGLGFALLCMGGNVGTSLFSRQINRSDMYSPLMVTFISMGLGSVLMLLAGLLTQGMGKMSGVEWLIIIWLAVINTALTFTIWNSTLRTLTAMESSIINNLMMPQIALLAYFFLKEALTMKEILGLVLVGIGVLIVQLARPRAAARSSMAPERSIG
jgi:drug/metabolite transporter (DMT)-like permease